MQYVFVSDSGDLRDVEISQSIAQVADSYLYSLVPAMDKQSSGILTVSRVGWDIIKANQQIFQRHCALIDSGGYSILSGVVPPHKINRAIQCYLHYAKCAGSDFDYLFSLDIPCSLKHPKMNTVQSILELNERSLQDTIELCRTTHGLSDKLFFVWHFKMRPQYYIWKNLHERLDISKYFHNHAIGGLVGIRKMTKINYSAFTGMAYGCLREFLKGKFNRRFRLHLLGVYLECDRFQIALLERLFRRYLEDIDRPALLSYDSVSPKKSAIMNAKKPFLDMSKDRLVQVYKTLDEVPDEYHRKVYTDGGYQKIVSELKKRLNGKKLDNAKSLTPLYVYSFGVTDRLFEGIIDDNELDKMIYNCFSFTSIKHKIEKLMEIYAGMYPFIFTKHRCKSILTNTEILHRWHRWFQTNYSSDEGYDLMMEKEITRIGFDQTLTLK